MHASQHAANSRRPGPRNATVACLRLWRSRMLRARSITRCMRSTLVWICASPACRPVDQHQSVTVKDVGARKELRTSRVQASDSNVDRQVGPGGRRTRAAGAARSVRRTARGTQAHLCCLGLGDVAEVDRLGGALGQGAPQVLVHALCGKGGRRGREVVSACCAGRAGRMLPSKAACVAGAGTCPLWKERGCGMDVNCR